MWFLDSIIEDFYQKHCVIDDVTVLLDSKFAITNWNGSIHTVVVVVIQKKKVIVKTCTVRLIRRQCGGAAVQDNKFYYYIVHTQPDTQYGVFVSWFVLFLDSNSAPLYSVFVTGWLQCACALQH